MKPFPKTSIAVAATLTCLTAAHAGTETWFTPLTESAPVTAPNSLEETGTPWVIPADITQVNKVSMREVEDTVLSPQQSIIRVNAGRSSSMFDMLAYDPSGEFLFIPHETPYGAGCSRYDIFSNYCEVIFQGDQGGAVGDYSNDYGAFDPCRFTPNGTLFLAEEWAGMGRVVELLNPFAPVDQIQHRVLNSIANVSHEGINFSKQYDNVIYFVDEDRSGSIYMFIMQTPGDYTVGQTFALSVDAYTGIASENYNTASNIAATRTGLASWIPLTDATGTPLPGVTDPFTDVVNERPGRISADDVGATPYGRPEDMAIGESFNNKEMLYFTATSEASVYSIEAPVIKKGVPGKSVVRLFCSEASTPKNVGFAPTTGVLNSPDNLAIDGLGNIYVIEDAPNGSSTGGDIWFARDTDNDGVAESLDHFMSIRVDGSEATGMIWNPVRRHEFAVCVQHPDSTDLDNVPDGLGDAVWLFDVTLIENQQFVQKLNNSKAEFGE